MASLLPTSQLTARKAPNQSADCSPKETAMRRGVQKARLGRAGEGLDSARIHSQWQQNPRHLKNKQNTKNQVRT